MATVAVGDVIRVTLVGQMFSQRTMSTFTYGVSTLTGAPEQITFFDRLDVALKTAGNLVPKWIACCPTEWIGVETWYQDFSPGAYAVYKKPLIGTIGTFDTPCQTANLAAVITRRGGLANRSNVSSLHVPIGHGAECIEDGFVVEPLKGLLDALAVQLTASVTTTTVVGTLVPVIFNGPAAADVSPIVNAFTQDTVRTMRRRNVRQGI